MLSVISAGKHMASHRLQAREISRYPTTTVLLLHVDWPKKKRLYRDWLDHVTRVSSTIYRKTRANTYNCFRNSLEKSLLPHGTEFKNVHSHDDLTSLKFTESVRSGLISRTAANKRAQYIMILK